ncbi:MAG: DUF1045 domain-containing protein [Pseudomonadota bacterium]
MDQFHRYAIYVLPAPGPLADFGASWLGWDAQAGREVTHPDISGLPLPVSKITATPRKYGFHGTIKPPFHLTDGTSAQELLGAFTSLCAHLKPAALSGLKFANLGRFLALVPDGNAGTLPAVAAKVVQDLDRFRAPPGEAELKRRRTRPLSAAQEANLAAWGYPYVLDEFRFHMTLTGSIKSSEDRAAVEMALRPYLDAILPKPFVVDSLCLLGSDELGRFHLIERVGLGG